MNFETTKGDSAENIEKTILRQILGVSLASIVLYLLNSSVVVYSPEVFYQSLVVFLFYLALFVWTFFPGYAFLKKRVITLVIFVSVLSGFFVLGGLKGLTAFDLANMFLFVSVLYKGKEKNSYLAILLCSLIGLFFVQLLIPATILDRSVSDPDWMKILNILFRIFLSVNVGMALRSAYSSEHLKVTGLLEEVNHLNVDITAQNEELKSMQEELRSNNDHLELLVRERTKKLELQNETLIVYSYLNSHVFRGPVCRIQGILNLLQIEKDEQIRKQLHGYLLSEVKDIDTVIKDISTLLYETDADFLEEIRIKARKLYNF